MRSEVLSFPLVLVQIPNPGCKSITEPLFSARALFLSGDFVLSPAHLGFNQDSALELRAGTFPWYLSRAAAARLHSKLSIFHMKHSNTAAACGHFELIEARFESYSQDKPYPYTRRYSRPSPGLALLLPSKVSANTSLKGPCF